MSPKLNSSFIVLLIGVFMAALNNGIISAALTTINSSFDVSATAGTWGDYTLYIRLSYYDSNCWEVIRSIWPKKLFLIEIVIFTIGSLGVALSPNFAFFHTVI